MGTSSAYNDLCNTCVVEMELKLDTHKHLKDNSKGIEEEEYEVVCPNCGRRKQVKIEKIEKGV